jgi:hypothetical protein
VDVNDDTEEPLGGDVTWAGDSWVVAYLAAVFPYDQSSIFVRRFVKKWNQALPWPAGPSIGNHQLGYRVVPVRSGTCFGELGSANCAKQNFSIWDITAHHNASF